MTIAMAAAAEDELFIKVLGPLAAAGQEACRQAVERAMRSGEAGRIPIAGAAVTRCVDGSLKTVALGHNHRIPEGEEHGYPTDHGETSAIRAMGADFGTVDWTSTVFATTLSPCVMCTRAIADLYSRGLRGLVIAESESFKGPETMFDQLADLKVVRLTRPDMAKQMQAFARRYPWDWAADIGELPPRAGEVARVVAKAQACARAWCSTRARGEAAVVDARGRVLAIAADGRAAAAGNSCHAAVICAMGGAGSAVNLRECAVVWVPDVASVILGVEAIGPASLGACELFRPAALVVGGAATALDAELGARLRAAGIAVVFAAAHRQPSRSRSPRSSK